MTLTPAQWAAIQDVVIRARFTLLEQRTEFARGELGDLDALEDALFEYERQFAALSDEAQPKEKP